jgi:hypothetical protein
MAFWTDVGLRALDTALASSQNIGDGVDRLARAGAGAEVAEATPAARIESGDRADLPADFGLGVVLRMQRTTVDLMAQAWQQWLSTFGTLASLGAGRSFRDAVEHQNPWLKTLSESLAHATETALRVSSPDASRRPSAGRERPAESRLMEHAAATSEPKRPRRGGRAKAATGSRTRSRRER